MYIACLLRCEQSCLQLPVHASSLKFNHNYLGAGLPFCTSEVHKCRFLFMCHRGRRGGGVGGGPFKEIVN